jgi:EAL domain-containing protein (putative c-di-GMP-specific phosphodiesterase class I)
MARNKKQDKRAVLEDKKNRLSLLEQRHATEGISVDPSIKIEIEKLQKEIAEDQRELEDSKEYYITPLPLLLEKYDAFFERFAEKLRYVQDPNIFQTNLLSSLGYAFDAEHAFIAQDNGARWEIKDKYESGNRDKDSDSFLAEVQPMIYGSVRFYEDHRDADPHKYVGITMGIQSDSDRRLIFARFPNTSPSEVLVLHGIKVELGLDIAIAVILSTLIETTGNFKVPQSSASIQISLFNALKRSFLHVSDKIYAQQLELFQEQLQKVVMYYEPIVSLSYYPYICRWEALARNEETKKMPQDLFETCELWGKQFQIELDTYCITTAVESYRKLPKRPVKQESQTHKSAIQANIQASKIIHTAYQSRVGDILPLSVNVYPETLICPDYRNAITHLAKARLLPLDKLTIELSEKRPLPIEDSTEGQDEMSWFRERLMYYTKLGITFAIDDYGVGFSSASRLSRLEPAIIKIDRDALLHSRGSHTIEHVLKLDQESMGKMIVIIEGFDDESKLTLAELYQMGIRYVQGHALGLPVPAEKMYRFRGDDEEEIVKKLGL